MQAGSVAMDETVSDIDHMHDIWMLSVAYM